MEEMVAIWWHFSLCLAGRTQRSTWHAAPDRGVSRKAKAGLVSPEVPILHKLLGTHRFL